MAYEPRSRRPAPGPRSCATGGVPVTAPVAGPKAVARWCAARGWPVHPLARGAKIPVRNCPGCRGGAHPPQGCPCRAAGRWCHGFHAATTDSVRIERWWSEDRFGVGVACGPAGLVVIDIDAHGGPLPARDRLLPGIPVGPDVDLTGLADGFHSLAVLAALHGERSPALAEDTLRVRTPSGGMHVWYRATPGSGWLSSAGSGRSRALAWQVDVRGQGGYIVAPGTVTRAGSYTPVGSCRTPAPVPAWLAGELARTGHGAVQAPVPAAPHAVPPLRSVRHAAPERAAAGLEVLATVLADLAVCARTPSGAGFTERLNRAAYTAGGLIAAGRLDAGAGERALTEAAELVRPGRTERSRRIIAAGITAGQRRPLRAGGRS